MKEGDKWQLTIPPELAYGKKGNSRIPGGSVLIFELELIEVNGGYARLQRLNDLNQ